MQTANKIKVHLKNNVFFIKKNILFRCKEEQNRIKVMTIAEYGYVELLGPIPANKTATLNTKPTRNSFCVDLDADPACSVSTSIHPKTRTSYKRSSILHNKGRESS